MKSLIAFFNNEDDVSQALNSMEEAGFDTSDKVSMIMNGITKSSDKKEEPFDETEEFNEARGAMSPLEARGLESESMNVTGVGEIVVAGKVLESLGLDENLPLDTQFDIALKELGIPDVEIQNFETRINSGQILVVIEIEESNFEEVSMVFSDAGAMLMNYDMQLD